MSNSMRSTEMTFWEIVTRQFLYTHLAKIESQNREDNVKYYKRILGMKQKSTVIWGVTEGIMAPRFNN